MYGLGRQVGQLSRVQTLKRARKVKTGVVKSALRSGVVKEKVCGGYMAGVSGIKARSICAVFVFAVFGLYIEASRAPHHPHCSKCRPMGSGQLLPQVRNTSSFKPQPSLVHSVQLKCVAGSRKRF